MSKFLLFFAVGVAAGAAIDFLRDGGASGRHRHRPRHRGSMTPDGSNANPIDASQGRGSAPAGASRAAPQYHGFIPLETSRATLPDASQYYINEARVNYLTRGPATGNGDGADRLYVDVEVKELTRMPEPSVPLRDIPQFEFHGDGIFFDPPGCNHGSVNEGTPEALANSLTINGDGEDHLLPPYAIFPETFSQDLLDVERESVLALEPEEAFASIAANPRYEGPAYEEVKATSEDIHLDLQKELVRLRSNPKAYMKRVREIGDHIYHIPSNSVLPTNHKMLKGVEHGWRTEGIVLAPNVLAGLRDVCPFRSPLCTANCLNLSGRAEWAGGQSGDVIDCRRRRTLMFMHVRDAFMARVAGLLDQRSAALPGRTPFVERDKRPTLGEAQILQPVDGEERHVSAALSGDAVLRLHQELRALPGLDARAASSKLLSDLLDERDQFALRHLRAGAGRSGDRDLRCAT